METIEIDKEEFGMQRAFMYGLTIRSDVPDAVRALIESIERKLAKAADVKSMFDRALEMEEETSNS